MRNIQTNSVTEWSIYVESKTHIYRKESLKEHDIEGDLNPIDFAVSNIKVNANFSINEISLMYNFKNFREII